MRDRKTLRLSLTHSLLRHLSFIIYLCCDCCRGGDGLLFGLLCTPCCSFFSLFHSLLLVLPRVLNKLFIRFSHLERPLTKDGDNILCVDHLLRQESFGKSFYQVFLVREEVHGPLVSSIDEEAGLFINHLSSCLRVGLGGVVFLLAVREETHTFVHTKLRDMAVGHVGYLLKVILGAARHALEKEIFRRTTTESHAYLVFNLLFCVKVVLTGKELVVAKSSLSTGDNRHLQ
mmetsp:Transcript_47096/g.121699  ORF Transcript_47096/g.121699 Transcript_47096/m.121699 type:complete len:231 (-) Transcript_47096:1944-2636(-)